MEKFTTPDEQKKLTPFDKKFWQLSLGEFKNLKMLCFAALIIAIRVVIKNFKIPIMPPAIYLGFDFLINSFGSMVYGPIVALAVGAVSDTLGAILFPIGQYFFPFIFVEMMSGFIFALFLYRQKLTTWRIILSRLSVVVICNFIINPIVMTWSNKFFYDKPYEFITFARVAKNAAVFPVECLLLVLWLGALSVATYKLGYTYFKPEKLKVTWQHIASLVLAVLLCAVTLYGYALYKFKSDSEKAIEKAIATDSDYNLTVEREKIDGKAWYYVGTIVQTNDGGEYVLTLHYDPINKVMPEADSALDVVAEFTGIDVSELKSSLVKFEPDGTWSYTFGDDAAADYQNTSLIYDGIGITIVPAS